jgi:hypothetical protein
MPLPIAREIHGRFVSQRKPRHAFDLLATMKLKRGTFPTTFFLACIAALELAGVALDDI